MPICPPVFLLLLLLLLLSKIEFGGTCHISGRPYTVFRWRPGNDARYKKTIICQEVAKAKNVCQVRCSSTSSFQYFGASKCSIQAFAALGHEGAWHVACSACLACSCCRSMCLLVCLRACPCLTQGHVLPAQACMAFQLSSWASPLIIQHCTLSKACYTVCHPPTGVPV
jgi:hypothetical protein